MNMACDWLLVTQAQAGDLIASPLPLWPLGFPIKHAFPANSGAPPVGSQLGELRAEATCLRPARLCDALHRASGEHCIQEDGGKWLLSQDSFVTVWGHSALVPI